MHSRERMWPLAVAAHTLISARRGTRTRIAQRPRDASDVAVCRPPAPAPAPAPAPPAARRTSSARLIQPARSNRMGHRSA